MHVFIDKNNRRQAVRLFIEAAQLSTKLIRRAIRIDMDDSECERLNKLTKLANQRADRRLKACL